MGFQILNSQNEPIKLTKIDEISSKFWKVQPEEGFWACPYSEDKKVNWRLKSGNWFDIICRRIEEEKLNDWDMVLMAYIKPYLNISASDWDNLTYLEKLEKLFNDPYMKPYIDLIQHFKSLKTVPKYVNEY